ncbi:MAG: aldo/keto reductase family oxidoreductase [Chitinophagia bacterium]
MKKLHHKPIVGCMRWGVCGENFPTSQYEQKINQCLEIGLDIFDHADIYGHYTTEADFGKALKGNTSLRSQIKIITKCGINMLTPNRPQHAIKSYDTSAAHIIKSVEQSLQNFHTDYIDTLLIHRPDILIDVEEVGATITELKKAGKIKSFGVSNFTTSQVALLQKYIPVEHHQVEISVTNLNAFENGILDQCQLEKIEAQSWSPMGNGLFTENTEQHTRILAEADSLSKGYECSINQILLAFLYAHPSQIVPIIGTTKFERISEAKKAMEIELKREDFYKLWTASTGKEVA